MLDLVKPQMTVPHIRPAGDLGYSRFDLRCQSSGPAAAHGAAVEPMCFGCWSSTSGTAWANRHTATPNSRRGPFNSTTILCLQTSCWAQASPSPANSSLGSHVALPCSMLPSAVQTVKRVNSAATVHLQHVGEHLLHAGRRQGLCFASGGTHRWYCLTSRASSVKSHSWRTTLRADWSPQRWISLAGMPCKARVQA